MDIFKWVNDIENVYEDLINNAKDFNLNDIEGFREEQRKEFENFINKKNEIINNALLRLSQDVKSEVKMFQDKIDRAIKKIEKQFQKNIPNLQKSIIIEAGLDF
jgi:vacuolar-type H+-ATPase subunit H